MAWGHSVATVVIDATDQRFPRAWDVDLPPGAFSAALEALTIACQLMRVFDCGRAPCKGDGRNQPNLNECQDPVLAPPRHESRCPAIALPLSFAPQLGRYS